MGWGWAWGVGGEYKSHVNIMTGSVVINNFNKSEISPFSSISRDWGKFRIPDLTRMALLKRY